MQTSVEHLSYTFESLGFDFSCRQDLLLKFLEDLFRELELEIEVICMAR